MAEKKAECVPHYTCLLEYFYDWQTIIAGVGAVIGGWLAYSAGVKQATATHEATEHSTKLMLERSQLVERPYISGGGVRAKEPFDISATGTVRFRETGEFEFHINNYGKTPGTLYKLGFGFCDETAIPKLPDYTFQYRRHPIDPGRHGEPIARQRIPPDHASPVVYGRFYYETIFGTRHSSGFIYRILPNIGPEPILPPASISFKSETNPVAQPIRHWQQRRSLGRGQPDDRGGDQRRSPMVLPGAGCVTTDRPFTGAAPRCLFNVSPLHSRVSGRR